MLVFAAKKTAVPAKAASADRTEELDRLKRRIDKLQGELTRSEETRSETADALRNTEKSISEFNRSIIALVAEQKVLDRELAELARSIATTRDDTVAQQSLLEKLVRQRFQQGGVDGLRLVLEGKDWGGVERQLHFLGYVGEARTRAIARLKSNAHALEELESARQAKKLELAVNVDAQKKARTSLQTERAARQKALIKVRADIAKGRKEIGRLRRDEERLSRLIERLAKTLQSHREEKRDSRGETIDSAADSTLSGRAFESLRGRLKLPVTGELRGRFGGPRDEGGVTWKGLFIKTDPGQAVRAVADGQVVYADWVRGFGNLVVVDHGGGYLSVYGNNETVLKQVGDNVTSGEGLATAGSSGGALESGVYFELRHEGKAFDPLRWVAR
jgi:septal ring factor EnvC (AmiA/AmiB activator)